MTIISLKYTNEEQNSIVVVTDTTSYFTSWPCHTWHAQDIQSAIDSGMVIEPWKTDEEILSELLNSLTTTVKSKRDIRMATGGYAVNVNGEVKWFQSDAASRIQQMTLSQSDIIPADLMWKTMDGSFVVMTKTLAQSIVASAINSDITIFGFAQSLLNSLATCTTKEELEAVDIVTGWPVIYGE